MTISITTTGIALTGPLDPISSIDITDPDGITKTLNMGLISSTGMDAIVADTDYTLQLSGFFNGLLAFVDPNAATIKPLSKLTFTLELAP